MPLFSRCVLKDMGQGSVGIYSQVPLLNRLTRILDGDQCPHRDGIKALDQPSCSFGKLGFARLMVHVGCLCSSFNCHSTFGGWNCPYRATQAPLSNWPKQNRGALVVAKAEVLAPQATVASRPEVHKLPSCCGDAFQLPAGHRRLRHYTGTMRFCIPLPGCR